jgi:hypothetical protein
MKNSLFISRHALASGSSHQIRSTGASAQTANESSVLALLFDELIAVDQSDYGAVIQIEDFER